MAVYRDFRIAGFNGLDAGQLALADDALAAAERGRSFYEVWKPSLEELRAMRGWLSDPRVGKATLNVFIEKAREAAGPKEWSPVVQLWAEEINAARTAYASATERIPVAKDPFEAFATVGKWAVIGVVGLTALKVLSMMPSSPRERSKR